MNKKVTVSKDNVVDPKLRPNSLNELIGRNSEKRLISMAINAARGRNEALDHVLFHGPPGLGKTLFANIIAKELGVNIKITSGPAIERQGDLAAILTNLKRGDILFIDEIHRLNKSVEEVLYPAMEDFGLDIIVGKGPGAKAMRLALPQFTLIGATTRLSLLSSPLRDRFGLLIRLDFFDDSDLTSIIIRAADVLAIKIDKESALAIAKRARGTARLALRLLKRVRDHARVEFNSDQITADIVEKALDLLGIDEYGLDKTDRLILRLMVDKFNGGPVGLSTLATAISEDKETIAEVIEPYLIKRGLIDRTKKGRVVTKAGYESLGVKFQQEGRLL
ncbi:Holliday junction branch migration DNA helicase RuvB [Candidatus Dojkabacteria bacterium]|nr:Holliday junction branch migration DNA helicase RuvB [Candidatus Dojkabacteria bacterium]